MLVLKHDFLHLFFELPVAHISLLYEGFAMRCYLGRSKDVNIAACFIKKHINLTLPGLCKPLRLVNDITILQACRGGKASSFTCAVSYHWQHKVCIPTAADSL